MSYMQDALVTSVSALLSKLATEPVVILDGTIVPLSEEEEQALCSFVERGGGLVFVGNAAEMYHEY
ncbi:MAG TPA: hypothetical protein VK667_05015, partial [Ktedonobacteraceae bacterium]|nr:hypothetical protein [Ktedonobacteraceae bacterium]